MLRIAGFEGRTVEDIDNSIVEWQNKLKTEHPDKVLQIVNCELQIRENEKEAPLFCSLVHALIPKSPGSKTLYVPAKGDKV